MGKLAPDWQESPRSVVLPGHDDVTGTDDDLVARVAQGRIDTLEIPGREIFLETASRVEAAAETTFPSNAEGNELLDGATDQWGNPLVYHLIDSSHARISSGGPDKTRQTMWDIGVIIEKVSADAPAPRDTWLGRRKAELGIVEKPSEGGFRRTEFSGGQSKLEGASYFRFFTWLVIGTAIIYIPFALLYRPKTYLHE